jgi:hypothetical protein
VRGTLSTQVTWAIPLKKCSIDIELDWEKYQIVEIQCLSMEIQCLAIGKSCEELEDK